MDDQSINHRSHNHRSQLDNSAGFYLAQISGALTVLSGATKAVTTPAQETPLKENVRGNHKARSNSTIQWALGINAAGRSKQYAQQGILEFWSVDTQQVEVSIHRYPSESNYQKQAVFHVGDRISPVAFPSITLEIQEPLPLHFLTRTASGIKTDTFPQLPLKIIW